jgi:hypothetical protein
VFIIIYNNYNTRYIILKYIKMKLRNIIRKGKFFKRIKTYRKLINTCNKINEFTYNDNINIDNNVCSYNYKNGIKCKNYELCRCMLDEVNSTNLFCINCRVFKLQYLQFKTDEKECELCDSITKIKVKFPAVNCLHWFCIKCSQNILFMENNKYYISPVDYNCSPCPNCIRKKKQFKECNCDIWAASDNNIDNSIFDIWKKTDNLNYNKWLFANTLKANGELESYKSIYEEAKCPICKIQLPSPYDK